MFFFLKKTLYKSFYNACVDCGWTPIKLLVEVKIQPQRVVKLSVEG